MNFTPKSSLGSVARTLTIVAVGSIVWTPASIAAGQNTSSTEQAFQTRNTVPIISAVEAPHALYSETANPTYYQPVSAWYKSKHWWKKNAPIIGGAGGGALVGGLLGGGAGAVVGGAAGGGAGYLYKRSRRHHYYHEHYYHHPYR